MALDLELADQALQQAAAKLSQRLAPHYPTDPARRYRETDEPKRRAGVLANVADVAERLLVEAIARERAARAAQELTVRALRNLGGYGASWRKIGELSGLTPQGAHKRYSASAGAPRAELTIDDVLETAEP